MDTSPSVKKSKPGPKPGYKQSPEHVAKRLRRGADHYAWTGSDATAKAGRHRALRLYPDIGPCIVCGSAKAERHHLDGNTANNEPSNIIIACRKCHMAMDGRLDEFREVARRNLARMRQRRWLHRIDTAHRAGDRCPRCSGLLSVTSTRKSGLVYIGCRKTRSGCGFNAGSYRKVLPSN
jgi:5-methylcytosine-specific restriction endonuclease McrA